MKRNPEIEKELSELSPFLAGLDNSMPYRAPEGYFAVLPDQLLKAAKIADSKEDIEADPPVFLTGKKPGFSVPDGYFTELPGQILNRIRKMEANEIDAELESYNPVLVQLRKSNPFYLKEGYFAGLKAAIPVEQREPARIIPLYRRKNRVRYAMAAVIMGLILFSGYLFTDYRNGESVKSLAESRDPIQVKADSLNISDEELTSFLEEHSGLPVSELLNPPPPDQVMALLEINDQSLSELLRDLSDAGISNYISENPESVSTENANQFN